jgi:hypothetical protein
MRPHDPVDPACSPRDLEPWETAVAGWTAVVGRVRAPAALGARLLAAFDRGRPALLGPVGAWRAPLAAAAALLLALGIGLFGHAAARHGGAAPGSRATADPPLAGAVLVDDPTLPLFHDLETFDAEALARDDGSR